MLFIYISNINTTSIKIFAHVYLHTHIIVISKVYYKKVNCWIKGIGVLNFYWPLPHSSLEWLYQFALPLTVYESSGCSTFWLHSVLSDLCIWWVLNDTSLCFDFRFSHSYHKYTSSKMFLWSFRVCLLEICLKFLSVFQLDRLFIDL